MPELSHDEIKQRLLELDNPKLSVAFAARMATLALSGLADGLQENKPFLWFWKKHPTIRLFNVLYAWWLSWAYATSITDVYVTSATDVYAASVTYDTYFDDDDTYFDDVATAASTADAYAAADAADAADAVIAAVAIVIDDDYAYIAYVCNTSKRINNTVAECDLANLKHIRHLEDFLTRPFDNFLNEEQTLFAQALRNLGDGFDYWADWYEARLRGEAIDEAITQKMVTLPQEIFEQSPAEINAYLKSLQNSTIPLNRVRIIFMGYGAAGKTSLIRVLNGESVVEGQEEMTPGVEIHEWTVPVEQPPDNPLIAHLWDFGGQVMAHATHKFFLRSRCLYVIVMEARTEINADEQAEYWLQHVRAFGSNAPVLLVANKADQTRLNLNMSYLREKYSNIIDVYPLSCTQAYHQKKPEFDCFKRDLIEQLQKVGTHQVQFSQKHFSVLQALRHCAAKNSFLEKQEFTKLCEQHGIQQEAILNTQWLLELLDDLGVVIHFAKIHHLREYLLNPRWITYGVYTILYSELAQKKQGKLNQASIVDILNQKTLQDQQGHQFTYSEDKCAFIIDAMEEFELSYRLPNDKHSVIIPALLPSDTPRFSFDKTTALAFDFDFSGFLPRNLITSLIVRRHNEIEQDTVWQNGVLLYNTDKKSRTLIQADYHERRLSLWITGESINRYFSVLHDEILNLVSAMPDLEYTEWVKLPNISSKKARADYRQLLAMEQNGELRYISAGYGKFRVADLLKNVVPEKKPETVHNHFYRGDQVNGGKNVGNIKATNIGNAQIGDHNTANMRDQNNSVAVTPNLEEVRQALAQLQERLAALNLTEKNKVARALDDATEELQKNNPDKKEIADALDRALKNVKKTGELTQAVRENILIPLETLAGWLAIHVNNFFA